MSEAAVERQRRVRRLIGGHVLTQAVYVVARLGVVDAIAPDGRSPVDEIAARVGADADALYRVLRALAAEGLFAEPSTRVFTVTEMGELLRDGDASFRYAALMHGEQTAPVFLHALDSVRTGLPVPLLRTGKSLWEQLAESPTDGEVFNRAMQTFAAAARIEPIWKLDWSEVGTVVDVGGGSGGMLLPLLRRESHLQGILFDQPHLEAESRAAIHNAGLEDRCRFEGGSFFDRVPEGADTYLLSAILHDWTDDDAVRILRSCNEAARTDSRLIVVEYLIPPGDAPHPGKSLDLLMLVWVGGRERTETEFRALLAKGGFRLERIIVTSSGFCALDASPQ